MDEKVERKIKDFKVPKGKQLVARVILEFTAITGVGIFLLGQYVLDKSRLPYQRGFYCDDENLKHPFLQETISEKACALIWVVLGLIVIPVIEYAHFKVFRYETWEKAVNDRGGIVSRLRRVPTFLLELYRICGYFLVGLLVCLVTTQIAKYQVGRLRPYFLSACNMDLTDDLCKDGFGYQNFVLLNNSECRGPWKPSEYGDVHSEYDWIFEECEGKSQGDCIEDIMNEGRKSFMSGHSSFSFYCAAFLIIYLHSRLSYETPFGSQKKKEGTELCRIFLRGLKVLRPFLQFMFFILAFWIALTRIKDYRHHPLDVVTGTLVGIVFSGLVLFGIIDIFNRPRSFTSYDAKYLRHKENVEASYFDGTEISEADGRNKVSNKPR